MSLVVQFRAKEAVTATLDGVSLADPGPGLDLVGSGILVNGWPGTYVSSRVFPLGPIKPIAGETITTTPGDAAGDVFFNLGIRVALEQSPQSIHGVWLDYHIGSTRYRALLPWLLSICQRPPEIGPCSAEPAEEFSFPPP